jgi:5-methyltetrahydropteroyltriglutamate--homocysteine methyltransferase
MPEPLPILPTSVIGSHAYPSWMWTALEAIEAGKYGATDQQELFDDAVNCAISDQERAGIDIVSDGEMRRWYFVQSFYRRMSGLQRLEPLRKVGVYGYDSVPRYRPTAKVGIPKGLGIVEEFQYLKQHTTRRVKATCPGPVTLSIHIRVKDDAFYRDRTELYWEFVPVINAELKALVAAGADFIQIDEPSAAIVTGELKEYIKLFNAAVEGVEAKIAYHVCFGNLASRPRGKREYAWMLPDLLNAKCDQLVLEFANREMKEVELLKEIAGQKEVGAGVVDVKSFYVEPAEDVAHRIRQVLKYVPAERLTLVPDCGFFQLPRWLAALKLKALAAGTRIVREGLTGRVAGAAGPGQ